MIIFIFTKTISKSMPKKLFFVIILGFISLNAQTQSDTLHRILNRDLLEFNNSRNKIDFKGALVLETWAIGNIATSAFRIGRTQGETKKFFQMNLYWNLVNFSLASVGIYRSLKSQANQNAFETLKEQHKIEKIYLVNTALDLAYIATGLYMRERGLNNENRRDLLRGFGRSLILQGAFLFVYDVSMYAIHRIHFNRNKSVFEKLSISPNGIGLRFQF